MFTPEVIQATQSSVLCWLATADNSGHPNVSPKEIFTIFDDQHLVIANIASPVSARNIRTNPNVCVSFIDIFTQKGFKVSGSAIDIPRTSADFNHWAEPLERLAGPRFPIRSVFVIRATEIAPIIAPSYSLFPDETTEQSQVESAMRTYGVRPAQ